MTSIYLAEAASSNPSLESWVHASSTEEALKQLKASASRWVEDQPDLLRFAGLEGARGWVYVFLHRADAQLAGVGEPLGHFRR